MEYINQQLPRPISWKNTCQYTGVFLTDASVYVAIVIPLLTTARQLLKSKFPPVEGWREYYHHMTIYLDELPEESNGYVTTSIAPTNSSQRSPFAEGSMEQGSDINGGGDWQV